VSQAGSPMKVWPVARVFDWDSPCWSAKRTRQNAKRVAGDSTPYERTPVGCRRRRRRWRRNSRGRPARAPNSIDRFDEPGDDPGKAPARSAHHLGQDDSPATSERPAGAPKILPQAHGWRPAAMALALLPAKSTFRPIAGLAGLALLALAGCVAGSNPVVSDSSTATMAANPASASVTTPAANKTTTAKTDGASSRCEARKNGRPGKRESTRTSNHGHPRKLAAWSPAIASHHGCRNWRCGRRTLPQTLIPATRLGPARRAGGRRHRPARRDRRGHVLGRLLLRVQQ
jgi:hypothetical protein